MGRLLLEQLPAGRILNLGAGSGVQDTRSALVVNVDHVAPSTAPSGLFLVAEATQLPFKEGAFDGALLKDVIEHLVDPIAALVETRRVVRYEGVLTVEVPRAIPRAVWADPTHVRGFTKRAITLALQMGGWSYGPARRMGGFPGAGRLGLEPHLLTLMRIPGFGHWFGTNWIVRARNDEHSG